MANDEHVAQLKQGVVAWNELVRRTKLTTRTRVYHFFEGRG
jgi:hypothetical protein